MLILNPTAVRFGASLLPEVLAIAIDRAAARVIEEWSDEGPFTVFVDAPEQRTTIKIIQALHEGDLGGPLVGDSDELAFWTAPNNSDAGRRLFSALAMIREVTNEITPKGAATRTITLAAYTTAGDTDPITWRDEGPPILDAGEGEETTHHGGH